jgi:hypothetical protein
MTEQNAPRYVKIKKVITPHFYLHKLNSVLHVAVYYCVENPSMNRTTLHGRLQHCSLELDACYE